MVGAAWFGFGEGGSESQTRRAQTENDWDLLAAAYWNDRTFHVPRSITEPDPVSRFSVGFFTHSGDDLREAVSSSRLESARESAKEMIAGSLDRLSDGAFDAPGWIDDLPLLDELAGAIASGQFAWMRAGFLPSGAELPTSSAGNFVGSTVALSADGAASVMGSPAETEGGLTARSHGLIRPLQFAPPDAGDGLESGDMPLMTTMSGGDDSGGDDSGGDDSGGSGGGSGGDGDLPVANDDLATMVHDYVPIEFEEPSTGVLWNDVSGDTITDATLVSSPSYDALYWEEGDPTSGPNFEWYGDGRFRYRPEATFAGLDTFTYYCTDLDGDSNVATVTIEVLNHPPVADDDDFDIPHDQTLYGSVSLNDSDEDESDDGELTYSVTQPPTEDLDFTFYPDGTFSYTPEEGFVGLDQFAYEVADLTGAWDSATATIDVTNQLPTVNMSFDDVWHWAENPTSIQTVSLGEHFHDPDDSDDDLEYKVIANSSSSVVNTSIVPGSKTLTLNFTGLPGEADLTVQAIDRPGEHVETTLRVWSVDVTGMVVEEKGWDQTWSSPEDGDIHWHSDDYRWKATLNPDVSDWVSTVNWKYAQWEDRTTDPANWNSFSSSGDANWAYGSVSSGDWAIVPEVHLPACTAYLVSAQKTMSRRITGTEWIGYAANDGETNLEEYPAGSGEYRILAGRNHPAGTQNPPGTDIGGVHNRVVVRVEMDQALPADVDVSVKLFDPDHAQDGGPAGSIDNGDPNDHTSTDFLPDDNFIGDSGALGMGGHMINTTLTIPAGSTTRNFGFEINDPHPGNNYIVAANHSVAALDALKLFGGTPANPTWQDDGKTLYYEPTSGTRSAIDGAYHTALLTVWRQLWVERDSMEAPNPATDGPFNTEDPYRDPDNPSIYLASDFLSDACIAVKPLPGTYDVTDDLDFMHNLWIADQNGDGGTTDEILAFIAAVRDVPTETAFWVSHVVGAYEAKDNRDNDPDTEGHDVGYCFGPAHRDTPVVFEETIRDFDDDPTEPLAASEAVQRARCVIHEIVHSFLGSHGEPGTAEGIMDNSIVWRGDIAIDSLTPNQIRLIQLNVYPK